MAMSKISKEIDVFGNMLLLVGCVIWAGVALFILFWAGYWIMYNIQLTLMMLAMFVAWASFMLWRSRS